MFFVFFDKIVWSSVVASVVLPKLCTSPLSVFLSLGAFGVEFSVIDYPHLDLRKRGVEQSREKEMQNSELFLQLQNTWCSRKGPY